MVFVYELIVDSLSEKTCILGSEGRADRQKGPLPPWTKRHVVSLHFLIQDDSYSLDSPYSHNPFPIHCPNPGKTRMDRSGQGTEKEAFPPPPPHLPL